MNADKTRKQLSITALFVIIFSTFMIAAFTITLLTLAVNKSNSVAEYKEKATNQIEIQNRLMNTHFNTIDSDLLFLPKLNEILRFKEVENEKDKAQIENEFLEFVRSRKIYDQLRFIDKTGMELIRVNYNNGNPGIPPKSELQNKSNRYYFKESISLPEGQVYISPFDLNVEQGEIETPLKPMIRFGTPVFNNEDETKGIVILNFLGQVLIDDLAEATRTHPGVFALINSAGYWLYNDNPDEEWGFMFPERKTDSLPVKDPVLWERLHNPDPLQFLTDEALYTARKIQLLPNDFSSDCTDCFFLLNTISTVEMGIDQKYNQGILLKVIIISAFFFAALSLLLSVTIFQRNKYRNALKESALYDQLTSLPNRILLDERAAQATAHSKRYKHTYAVMFIDLDGFKLVNDEFGHKAGDELLQEVGKLLVSCVRETDTVARFGGDEFVILLSQISDKKDCASVAEKILSTMFNDFDIAGHKIRMGASIGIAALGYDSTADFEQAMQAADAAMYDIKKSGKNSFRIVLI